MTICIGAICEGGKAIVMAADRMVTWGNFALQMGGEQEKIVSLAPGAAVGATGTFEDAAFVLDRLRHSAELMAAPAVEQVAYRMRKLCEQRRAKQIELTITRPFLRMSFAKFAELSAGTPNTQVMTDVFKLVQEFKFQLTLIVAGIDAFGPHLYSVSFDGVNSHASTGFIAVGCGAFTASNELVTKDKVFTNQPLPETIYSLFAAKKAAEHVPGVGASTDIAVIRPGTGTVFLKQDHLNTLAEIHKRLHPPKLSDDDSSSINGFFS